MGSGVCTYKSLSYSNISPSRPFTRCRSRAVKSPEQQAQVRKALAHSLSVMRSSMLWAVLSMTLVVWTSEAHLPNGGPIPAADIPTQCNSVERCCMPTPYTGTPGIREFKLDTINTQPWRIRRPVHLLTPFEVSRLERAYAMMRALPDSDPRSLLNQMNMHCLYCDNALHFPGKQFPLEIHDGWIFLPWHRMFLFWHERILATLVDDDSFALPFWGWDSSEELDPLPNSFPAIYYNRSSSLWNPTRNNCTTPEKLVDMDTNPDPIIGCTNKTAAFLKQQNDRLLYSQLVTGAPTPGLFYGLPYYFGDIGGTGPGTFEVTPHGPVHVWVGGDMRLFGRAGFDPVFYAHHGNIDRMWTLWQGLPGGVRTIPMDRAFNNSMFTFYDENANLVKMSVQQVLDLDLLRYSYEVIPTPWVTNGVPPGEDNIIPFCNPLNQSATAALISSTPEHKPSQVLGLTPISFRIERPKVRPTNGTEILELSGILIPNISASVTWRAYLFFPQAVAANGPACPEYVGMFQYFKIAGLAAFNPKRVWRVAIGPKLVQIGKDDVKDVVVTMVQTGAPSGQNVTFSRARILYDFGPSLPL